MNKMKLCFNCTTMTLGVLLLLLLNISVSFVNGLRNVRARVPEAVRQGETAILCCDFDLEGDKLYSVKWYKGRHEFYRFTPRERPAMKIFPIPGLADLDIQMNNSNAKQLSLRNVTLTLSGRYSCEISADAPSFHTALVSGDMDVVVTPDTRPELRGMKPRYRVGDRLMATCISRHSKPAANLTWSINSSPITNIASIETRLYREPGTKLWTVTSYLQLALRRDHFTESGRIKVRCTASLYKIHWQTTENSAESERPKAAMVAASNAVDTRPYSREKTKITEDKMASVPSNVSCSTTMTSWLFRITRYIWASSIQLYSMYIHSKYTFVS